MVCDRSDGKAMTQDWSANTSYNPSTVLLIFTFCYHRLPDRSVKQREEYYMISPIFFFFFPQCNHFFPQCNHFDCRKLVEESPTVCLTAQNDTWANHLLTQKWNIFLKHCYCNNGNWDILVRICSSGLKLARKQKEREWKNGQIFKKEIIRAMYLHLLRVNFQNY